MFVECFALPLSDKIFIITDPTFDSTHKRGYKVEMELDQQLAASFPHPGDKTSFARCSSLTLGKMPWVWGFIAWAV